MADRFPARCTRDTRPTPRRTLSLASGARLFATVRGDRDGNAVWLVGIELEPTFVLLPYSLERLGGAR